MYLTTIALTALVALTAAEGPVPTVILQMRNGLSVLSGLPGNCITYSVDQPVETVQINTPCRFYDEMECAGNGTDYTPETEIPVGAVGEVGSVQCGEEEEEEEDY
ncbi:hypothetical protein CNMCM8980_006617 [Aspergillus fumigatiaffinis]|jgi:hypothetical protein|uniref:Uncharacterized protein n=1 Tax=Aspergillus fumigatiaffinis TaxID=340414 RepID=A0A8H4H4V9_9EURO|nr:hypothetical protein CNMCM5878_007318 [Aspergillus fumigatiaffinis]KAF4228309.1 hypothetical protein CNMCM6457_006973 [Aspergillus fumigatiaffinis]KAF4236278.1 hypothetical protein CNMCM6805_007630 [Aspergillus fumigatiaffinis]KAF4247992.1 hypothetical protein CNMCM8980_006617 [Aspergillus fumigatiaffinis]